MSSGWHSPRRIAWTLFTPKESKKEFDVAHRSRHDTSTQDHNPVDFFPAVERAWQRELRAALPVEHQTVVMRNVEINKGWDIVILHDDGEWDKDTKLGRELTEEAFGVKLDDSGTENK